MTYTWIKLYHEILNDPKMGRLSDHLWRIAIELFLMAGENGRNGVLPPFGDMAWRLRMDTNELLIDLVELAEVGIITATDTEYIVTNFEKRQSRIEPAEKQRQYRERKDKEQYYGNEDDNDEGDNDEEEPLPDVTEAVTNTLPMVTQTRLDKNQNQTRLDKTKTTTIPAVSPPSSTSPPIDSKVLSLFRNTWGVKRPNAAQLSILAEVESKYPLMVIQEFVKWARVENMSFGHAVNSSRKALANWSKPKPSPNGAKPRLGSTDGRDYQGWAQMAKPVEIEEDNP